MKPFSIFNFQFSIYIAASAAMVLAVCSLVLGPLNQDEGWYLLAGLNTADGMMPYRDYMFTQGPVMAAVYALFSPLWSPFGVLGGRVFTLTLSILSLVLWCVVARRLGGRNAAFVTFCLLALNPVYSYFTAIPKTYALSGLFIASAFYDLTSQRRFRYETAALALALAAGTRLSLGILLPVVGLWLIFAVHRFAWLRFGVAGILTLAIIYTPFLIICPEQFVYSQTYHAAREGGGLFSWLVLRGGFVSRLLQGYFPVFALLLFGLYKQLNTLNTLKQNGNKFNVFNLFDCLKSPAALLAVSFLAVTALHFLTPFPYDDYQTPIMPLAAVIITALMYRHGSSRVCTTILSLAFLLSSPMIMNWMVIRQDRFWFDMKEKPDIIVLRETGKLLRNAAAAGGRLSPAADSLISPPPVLLLTQDAYLAVEARMRVPRGLEMGPFSYFPDLSDDDARKFNVHNTNTLRELVENSNAPFAAFSGYAFAISCPTTAKTTPEQVRPIIAAVLERYEFVDSVAEFGQCHTPLTIWEAK